MEINDDVVKNVAKVARLNLTKEELDEFTPQLQEVLDAFSSIDAVDTTNTKMSIQPVVLKNSLRDDTPKPSLSVDDALENTYHKKDNYFKGPKAI
jgi:aspartyl-tRNA(Asn)/glutamyl-tRNA(Gln) amidotransferase subunit C